MFDMTLDRACTDLFLLYIRCCWVCSCKGRELAKCLRSFLWHLQGTSSCVLPASECISASKLAQGLHNWLIYKILKYLLSDSSFQKLSQRSIFGHLFVLLLLSFFFYSYIIETHDDIPNDLLLFPFLVVALFCIIF